MNLEEALEKYGLKLSEEEKQQDIERYNIDISKFKKMLEESKLHTFGLSRPATTEYMEFNSELPDYFNDILRELRK